MNDVELTVRPFTMGTLKEAALKPLEEASEVHGAWQMARGAEIVESRQSVIYKTWLVRIADEIADTIQACVNLAARYDLDLVAAMERCEERNRERGRYDEMSEDARRVFDRLMDESAGKRARGDGE